MKRFAVTAALVVSAVLVIAQPASASWQQQSTPTPPGSNPTWSLSAVSCTATATCMAVGNVDSSLLSESRSGNTWTIVSIPDPGGGQLPGIWCTSSSCEAVGRFDNGGTTETLAEVWNGSSWSVQSTPNPAGVTSSQLNDVSCVSASRCEAVGQASISGGNIAALAEEWNGGNWTIKSTQDVGGAVISELEGVSCTAANACEAVGESRTGNNFPALAEVWNGSNWTIAERWNGTNWTVQPTQNPAGAVHSFLISVSCPSTKSCIAVGFFTNNSGNQTPFAEHWNGTNWVIKSTPSPPVDPATQLNSVSCTSSTSCEAVGTSTTQTWGEVWNGTKWTMQSVPSPAGGSDVRLRGVSCTASNACTGVGAYFNGTKLVPLAERWNGSTWAVQAAAVPSGSSGQFSSVSCNTTQFNIGCNAVGSVTKNGIILPLAENWNGWTWAVKPAQSPDPNVTSSNMTSVSCSSLITCMGVGFYETSTGVDAPLGELYN